MNERNTFFSSKGGSLSKDAPSYIKRPADEDLPRLLQQGEFCYVLTARQMGKSSLMVRASQRLSEEGFLTVIIDLTGMGKETQTPESWYLGLAERIGIGLSMNHKKVEDWWNKKGQISPSQKFNEFLREVVLEETPAEKRIVVFIDEIDTTIDLKFTADFYAMIRACYNARSVDPQYKRLTFALFGVATPSELMPDETRTPFNIGAGIQLEDFSITECQPFKKGLPFSNNDSILERVYFWTNGQPFLTQRLCAAIRKEPDKVWDNSKIDELVNSLFLGTKAWQDLNIPNIRERLFHGLESKQSKQSLLTAYKKLFKGKTKYDEHNRWHTRLRLSGLVKKVNGSLEIRNRIYNSIFNQTWIRENMPINWAKRIAIGFGVALLIAIVGAVALYVSNADHERKLAKIELLNVKTQAENDKLLSKARVDSITRDQLLAKTRADSAQLVAARRSEEKLKAEQEAERYKRISEQKQGIIDGMIGRTSTSGAKGVNYVFQETSSIDSLGASSPNLSRLVNRQFGDITVPTFTNMAFKTIITLFIPSSDKRFRPNMVITRDLLPEEQTLEDFVSRQKQALMNAFGFGNIKMVEEGKRRLGALDGYKMVYSIKPEGVDFEVMQVQMMSIQGKVVYSVTASTGAETWETVNPIIMYMVDNLMLPSPFQSQQ